MGGAGFFGLFHDQGHGDGQVEGVQVALALLDPLLQPPEPDVGIEPEFLDLPLEICREIAAGPCQDVRDGGCREAIDDLTGGLQAKFDVRGASQVLMSPLQFQRGPGQFPGRRFR